MRTLALRQGPYVRRIIEHLKAYSPPGWTIETVTIPKVLLPVIDEPEEFIPSDVTNAELLLALTESEGAAQLIPALARFCHARAVILPVDDPAWLPAGLKSQIRQELESDGISVVFPKTFCTLTENSAGFRRHAEFYNDETIASFAKHFGRPSLKLTIDPRGKRIIAVSMERGSPCGSTQHAAEKLIRMMVDEAIPRAGLIVHQFPCLATMQSDETDEGIFKPLMHLSGYVINEEIERELKAPGQ